MCFQAVETSQYLLLMRACIFDEKLWITEDSCLGTLYEDTFNKGIIDKQGKHIRAVINSSKAQY